MKSDRENPSSALLRVAGLRKTYVRGDTWRRHSALIAVNDVSLEIAAGETLGLVGASGSGKSTVARCISRLEKPDGGEVWLDGIDLGPLDRKALLPFRSQLQLIFQDPATAMNPRFSAAEVIEEPLLIQGKTCSERQAIVESVMKEVALSPDWLGRGVSQFSGGQKQRIAIARALALRPKLLVLDEALTGLDVSTQAQIANLLLDLQARHGLTYLLISHDLTLVARMADHIAVMAVGRIVERGEAQQILREPQEEETRRLVGGSGAKAWSASAAGGPA